MEPAKGNVVGADEVAMANLILELLLWRMIKFFICHVHSPSSNCALFCDICSQRLARASSV